MCKPLLLSDAAYYSEERINASKVSQENFITIDNILQNKNGITISPIKPNGNLIVFEEGDILVGNIRPYLKKIWFSDRKGGCSPDVLAFKSREGFYPKYIYYSLFRDDFFNHMMKGSKGTKMPRGDKGQILRFHIPDFEISYQQKISSILTSLDSKIELNKLVNAELEAMAKTLYDYWFVQFDFPDKNGKPYKSSGGKMVWDEELQKEIPEGWEASKIGDILFTSLGGTPSTAVREYWKGGTISWLNSGEIANFPIIDTELKITEAAVKKSATELLPKGSVMLSITRHLRPSVLAIDACANQSVVGIKEKGDIRYFYLYPYLKNEVPRLNAMRSGAQQPHINKDIVDESYIVVPGESSNILKKYNSIVGPLYERIINNALQNQQLAKLRDWLLPILMNGQVKVG
jgi:type I restriction enzyme S subunit